MLQDLLFEMYTAPEACLLYAPVAVCFLNMVLEHIWPRIFVKIINGPGAYGPGAYGSEPWSWTINGGQNLKKHITATVL